MDQKDITWGMIGFGDVTEVKNGPGLYLCQHSILKGVVNRTRSRAQDWVRRHGHGQVYDSAESLLADPEIDIVYVATTPDTHLKYAVACAEAGKHCLLEKPVAATYEEGIRIRDAFRQSGRRCYVAFYRRQMNRFQTLRDLIDSGRIGEVMGAQLLRCAKAVTEPGAWRANPSICCGDMFTETDIHALDILLWIMGTVKAWNVVKSEDGYGLLIRFEDDKLASGFWNYRSLENVDRFEIFGTTGRIAFSFFDNTQPLRIWDNRQGYEEILAEDSPHVGMRMEQAIVDELRGTGCFSATIQESLRSLEIAAGAYFGK